MLDEDDEEYDDLKKKYINIQQQQNKKWGCLRVSINTSYIPIHTHSHAHNLVYSYTY